VAVTVHDHAETPSAITLNAASAIAEIRTEEFAALEPRLQAGETVEIERHCVDANGTERTFWVSYRPSSGGVIYAYGTDITESRRTQIRLNMIVEGTGLGTWEWNAVTGSVVLNAQLPRLVGAELSDIVGSESEWLSSLIDPADDRARGARLLPLLKGTNDSFEYEYRARHRQGHWVWLLERGKVIRRGGDGRPCLIIGTVHDVSTLKQQEEELQRLNTDLENRVAQRTMELEQAKAEAERATHAKSEFLSRMSHELRTPMNAIIGFGRLLGMVELPSEASEFAKEIDGASQHLLALINEILDLESAESGKIQFTMQAVAMRPLIDECVSLIVPAALRRSIDIENRVATRCVPVSGDPWRLKQVLVNLLSNAVKYNRRAGRITVTCEVVEAGWCEISVIDTGPGLSESQIARAFDPFERLGVSSAHIEGTGIGLSLSKRFVELMGGSIGAESRVGHGCRFWIRMRAADVTPATSDEARIRLPSTPRQRTRAGASPGTGTGTGTGTGIITVVYVEDNQSNQRLMQRIASFREDLELICSSDPQEALTLIADNRPALVLLDINLPGMDGFELLRRMRSRGISAPAVAVSADVMPDALRRGEDAGFADYLTKPVDIQRVRSVLNRFAPHVTAGAPVASPPQVRGPPPAPTER